jgi:predicted transglutaminase-like cysteine proteinase
MRRATAAMAALAVGMVLGGEAGAGAGQSKVFGTEYGKTLPPYGYVNFCRDDPKACNVAGPVGRVEMTPDLWATVRQVNLYVNSTIKAATDRELYGIEENWVIPTAKGDCEDYVLLKRQALEGYGISPAALLITVVLDELMQGHAVLTLTTTAGDVVLDNRRNDVLLWSKTSYTFLKRQSSKNPSQWVSLVKQVDLTPQQPIASQ